MTQTRYNHGRFELLDSIQQLMRAVSGERLAFQAGTEEFEPPSPLQWKSRKINLPFTVKIFPESFLDFGTIGVNA